MSTWAPDYEFYAGEYNGQASEEAFKAELPGAVAHVGWLIGWNEVTADTATSYKRAVCACVDAFAAYGHQGSGGFTIGSFSVSGDSSGRTGEDVASDAARKELATSGLLWAGVR